MQAWQPLRGPVLDSPLALLDASSVRLEDAMGLELRYNDWTGEAHLLHHSPDHRQGLQAIPAHTCYIYVANAWASLVAS